MTKSDVNMVWRIFPSIPHDAVPWVFFCIFVSKNRKLGSDFLITIPVLQFSFSCFFKREWKLTSTRKKGKLRAAMEWEKRSAWWGGHSMPTSTTFTLKSISHDQFTRGKLPAVPRIKYVQSLRMRCVDRILKHVESCTTSPCNTSRLFLVLISEEDRTCYGVQTTVNWVTTHKTDASSRGHLNYRCERLQDSRTSMTSQIPFWPGPAISLSYPPHDARFETATEHYTFRLRWGHLVDCVSRLGTTTADHCWTELFHHRPNKLLFSFSSVVSGELTPTELGRPCEDNEREQVKVHSFSLTNRSSVRLISYIEKLNMICPSISLASTDSLSLSWCNFSLCGFWVAIILFRNKHFHSRFLSPLLLNWMWTTNCSCVGFGWGGRN